MLRVNKVDFREIGNGLKISTVGIGSGELKVASKKEIERIIAISLESGINFMDTCMSDDSAVAPIARALKGRRDKMVMQMHFCTVYPKRVYSRTRVLSKVQKGFFEELRKYGTDYADIGMIHFIDSDRDMDKVLNGGIFEHALKLKREGVIRCLGFSSHTPSICKKMIDETDVDMFMLGVNPAFDFEPKRGKLALSQERSALYRECQRKGIAITVMKAFNGGQLLNAGTSPFGRAMTLAQCLQYALDRPAVASCLAGVRSVDDLEGVLRYYDTTEAERDYSFIGDLPHRDMAGVCVYCNHCLPCPVGIDIGTVNKYLDLAKSGDEIAADHYRRLPKSACDCTNCGVCENRCPFQVKISNRMAEAQLFFK